MFMCYRLLCGNINLLDPISGFCLISEIKLIIRINFRIFFNVPLIF